MHSYSLDTLALKHSRFTDTTAKVHSLAFNSSSTHLAAASLDESITIYNIGTPSKVISTKNACVFWSPSLRSLDLSLLGADPPRARTHAAAEQASRRSCVVCLER